MPYWWIKFWVWVGESWYQFWAQRRDRRYYLRHKAHEEVYANWRRKRNAEDQTRQA